MKEAQVLIKKYPNRRLYDTSTSAYITLDDVKAMVERRVEIKVVDAKTEQDLTRQTLMQILLEQESGGAPIFSSQMLARLIGFYGNAHASSLGMALDSSLQAFIAGADEMARRASAARAGATLGMDAMSQMGQSAWTELAKAQGEAMGKLFAAWTPKPGPSDKG